MKVVAIREAKQALSSCVDDAQRERVLITRHGKPAAIVIGVEGREFEDVLLMSNPRFWELIEARRRQPTLSLEEVRAQLRDTSRTSRNVSRVRRGSRRRAT